ncbi:unnamed protein product [Danaus chrysippus]|uniref:(African queen) hypothetical protein n=1 Tax=Danaus chrysippus TaxID=151541 RepID=A0A8J2QJ12_9NEOP|nr:unnamed protein product [Danaus chrysippus]
MTLRVEVPGEKIISHVHIESCKCKPFENEPIKTEQNINGRVKEFIKKTWALRSKVTVEPYVICYVLPSVLAGLAVQNLCLEKSCLVNLKYDEDTCYHIMQGRTSNYTEQEENVQKMVASMTAWSFPLQTALPGILTLFVGAWSDRTGNRKSFMVLPILGKLISCFGIILSTVFFLYVGVNETALIEGVPPALAGGRVAMTMAVYSYITDITIACVFYMTGFIYILFRLKVKKKKSIVKEESQTVLSMFSVKDLAATVNVAFKSRQGSRRLQIILIMLAYMFIVGPVLGEAQMTYWFTRYKFKFTEVDYSLFLTYSVLVGTIGSFVTIYLLSKRWKIEDSIIGMVACVSRIAASLVYAMAPTRTIYFIGPVLDMFSSAGATSLRSIATKLVKTDEVGKTSSLISISEALVPVIYSPVYSKLYLSTLSTFPGAFYLISAALAFPAILIYLTLFILRRRDIKEDIMNEKQENEKQESKSKDNEITRF